jgi:hypothetical protein
MGERVELEQVLADAREEAAVLESNRAAFSVDRVRQLLAAVSESAEVSGLCHPAAGEYGQCRRPRPRCS